MAKKLMATIENKHAALNEMLADGGADLYYALEAAADENKTFINFINVLKSKEQQKIIKSKNANNLKTQYYKRNGKLEIERRAFVIHDYYYEKQGQISLYSLATFKKHNGYKKVATVYGVNIYAYIGNFHYTYLNVMEQQQDLIYLNTDVIHDLYEQKNNTALNLYFDMAD